MKLSEIQIKIRELNRKKDQSKQDVDELCSLDIVKEFQDYVFSSEDEELCYQSYINMIEIFCPYCFANHSSEFDFTLINENDANIYCGYECKVCNHEFLIGHENPRFFPSDNSMKRVDEYRDR